MESREEYVRQAEAALARGRSSTQISKAETELRSAAVLVALAGLAEPSDTVTVHGDDGEVRTDALASTVADSAERENRCCEVVSLADGVPVTISDLRARITRHAVAYAIRGNASPDWRTLDREVRAETLEAADRVVDMLLGRDA